MLGVVKPFVLTYNGSMNAETKVIQKLRLSQKTLSVAESCTGGLVAHRLTNVPGSSAAFHGAVVSYSNQAKVTDLKIPEALITAHGSVSGEVALFMAKSIRKRHHSDYGIGITGIAGPEGGTKTKPVGLTFIAVVSQQEALCIKCQFEGPRASVKKQSSTQALKLLDEFIY